MSFRRILFSCLLLGPLTAGCANYEPEFVVETIIDGKDVGQASSQATERIRKEVQDHFGTPNQLVAWGLLPIEFGTIEGTVLPGPLETGETTDSIRAALDGDLPGDLKNLAAVFGADSLTVAGYDSDTRVLTFQESIPIAQLPQPGTTFRVLGHQLQHGKQLYMRHCMHCHGVTGDGRGPTARYIGNHKLNPLPRDFRRGIFKFTSIKMREYARRSDLKRTIRQGLPGTYMPSFLLLEADELNAIVEYVRFLSMRGEFERRLLVHFGPVADSFETARKAESDAEKKTAADQAQKKLEKQLLEEFDEALQDAASLIAENWQSAENPSNLIVPGMARIPDSPESRQLGRNLFLNRTVDCKKCHGPGGRGNGVALEDFQKKKDGSPYNEPGLFDDWNHHVTPRDLTSGIYRGGRRPLDLFRRVTNGVGGTPMAGFATLKEEDRWHIVNYVLSIPIEGAFLDDHDRASQPSPAPSSKTAKKVSQPATTQPKPRASSQKTPAAKDKNPTQKASKKDKTNP